MDAAKLFESAMHWLRQHYADYRFFTERDLVWTVQLRLLAEIESRALRFHVSHEYTVLPRNIADLVILEGDDVAVAVELKYEPDHSRSADRGGDILKSKLDPSVVDWTAVENDVVKAQRYVTQRAAKVAYAVFIDEGGWGRRRPIPDGCEWRDWGGGRWALWSRR